MSKKIKELKNVHQSPEGTPPNLKPTNSVHDHHPLLDGEFDPWVGTKHETFAEVLRKQVANASVPGEWNRNKISNNLHVDALWAALGRGIEPKSELEAMLGAQMVSTHNLAMRYMTKSLNTNRVDHAEKFISFATKLMRLFNQQIETLNKHRGKGQQKMTVEHVTVNQGGQAIVGNVVKEKGGGRQDA